MAQVIKAVVEKGLLRPLRPLNLRERQTVRIQVLADEPALSETLGEAARLMIAAGMMRPKSAGPIPEDPVPADEGCRLQPCRLADLLGAAPGKPLSEIVLESLEEG